MSDQPEPLWQPDATALARANVTAFCQWLHAQQRAECHDYHALWTWSVESPGAFWTAIADFFDLPATGDKTPALASSSMPGARWFENLRVNYVDQVYRHADLTTPAVIYSSEDGEQQALSWRAMQTQVAALARTLRELGVKPGDRVVAYLQNVPEAIIAFHAAASIGAVWSVCAPDLGVNGVLDRFQQIEPKVLIAGNGYRYGGKDYPRDTAIDELLHGLPSLTAWIRIACIEHANRPAGASSRNVRQLTWDDAVTGEAPWQPQSLAFSHPLWIVYSSGTTGKPKAIVHGHGGIVLEHLKQISLQMDIGAGDRFMWYSSTAWMMWNYNIAGLLVGATVCLYDGNPGRPDMYRLWQVAAEMRLTHFGAGAAFFDACTQADMVPAEHADLSSLRALGATGSPLTSPVYDWIYSRVSAQLYLSSISGGTDFASACVGGSPTLPVYRGEITCRSLGCAVEAFDDAGNSVIDEVGELVITQPMPSMPIYFWNDADNAKYLDSYFSSYPGIWRHGDWIRITSRGSCIIYGRSDSTINRQGIRMGTSELYQVVESLPEVVDSLVVDLEFLGRDSYLPLFVVLAAGAELDERLMARIKQAVRNGLSPRHVPNDVFAVTDIPRTFSGKKMEIPVRRLLLGRDEADAINRDTMANPASIEWFIRFAARLSAQQSA
ncbi:MAG: acetoacetate--CoA ligase [Pseudomonadota bacterium]